jgi:hypothetical protein
MTGKVVVDGKELNQQEELDYWRKQVQWWGVMRDQMMELGKRHDQAKRNV